MKILAVVPTHDRTEFLEEALRSLDNQTRRPDKIIVTGNVAPRNLRKYVYANLYTAFSDRVNHAIESTDCDAFFLLCDDDTLLPQYVEKTSNLMRQTNADIVYTEFNDEPVTSLCTKEIWRRVGGFRAVGFFDWDFYWSCREAGAKSVALREHLFEYRLHPAQGTLHQRQKDDGTWAKWTDEMLKRHPKRGKP